MTPARAWRHAKWGGALFLVALPLTLFLLSRLSYGDLRISWAFHEIDMLGHIVEMYRDREGSLPSSLNALADQNLLDHHPKDPWGGEYIYRLANNARGYELYSPGINGIDEGGAGDDVVGRSKHYACKAYGLNCPFTGTEWVVLALVVLSLTGLLGFLSFGCTALCAHLIRRKRKNGFPPARE